MSKKSLKSANAQNCSSQAREREGEIISGQIMQANIEMVPLRSGKLHFSSEARFHEKRKNKHKQSSNHFYLA